MRDDPFDTLPEWAKGPTTDETGYRTGDVANGHVLSSDGHWLPVVPALDTRRRSYLGWAVLGGILAAIFVFVIIAYAAVNDSARSEAQVAWDEVSPEERDQLCGVYRDAPDTVRALLLLDGYAPELVSETMVLLDSEC
jgi:hypothetical protein